MKTVFADTHYWLAVANPRDPWAEVARAVRAQLAHVRLITTDDELTERLAAVCRAGPVTRRRTANAVRAILADPDVRVVPSSRESFLLALDRYERREDKSYGLTDCRATNVMDAEGIVEVLTNDHHFQQEGYTILMRK
jgi:predicted nucleic acid-binding protein